MTDSQQREAARQFFYRWNGKGKEDEHARSYWIELLSDVFGVERVTERVEFEKKVAGEKSKKRIDVYMSGGELTAEVTADYLRREHLPDRAFSSEKARYYQPAGTMP